MMHKAWCSIEEVPYNFSGSSNKFLGHPGWKIDVSNPIWVRLLGRPQLSNPSDLPCFYLCSFFLLCEISIIINHQNNENIWTLFITLITKPFWICLGVLNKKNFLSQEILLLSFEIQVDLHQKLCAVVISPCQTWSIGVDLIYWGWVI